MEKTVKRLAVQPPLGRFRPLLNEEHSTTTMWLSHWIVPMEGWAHLTSDNREGDEGRENSALLSEYRSNGATLLLLHCLSREPPFIGLVWHETRANGLLHDLSHQLQK